MGDKDVEDMVEKYLLNHPDFAYKWYAQNGPLAPRSSSSGSVDPVVSSLGSVAPTVHLLRTQLSANQRGTPSLAALVTQTGSEDSEHLAASYVQMTRGGRNSVTCQLFKEMLSSDVTSGRKNSRLANGQRSMSEMTIGNRDQLNERLRHLDEQELFMELIRDISNELDIDTLCHKILVNVSILTKSDRGSLFLAKGSRNDRYLVAKLFDVTPDSLLEQSIIAAEQYSKQPIPFGLGIAGHVALTKETIVIKDAYEDARFNKDIDARTGYRTVSIMCKPILNCQGDVIGVAQCINKTSGDHEFTKADERVFARYLTFCGIGIQNAQLFEMSIQEYKRNQWTERSILSVPIQSSSDAIIGVAQLVNKVDGDHCTVFTEVDVATLEAFAIFCGLGIHNTQIYEQALKLMAKQKVALEILSYHASSSIEETRALMTCDIPSAETFKLYKYDFCDFTLDDRETCLASLSMFLELQLIAKFHIPYNVLCRWVLSVKKNYRPVVYHNWRHSLNVTQTMFAMLTVGGMHELFSDLEQLALLVACLCHDLDHRGTNNSFQTK
ncbi:cGMP-specific 3',5'-cyclic phosphodiesterase [Halotydeus destructor]|nr:cGMP-specific 3',5'-cyclic phosphodiesterase [Halotydeus destructor]